MRIAFVHPDLGIGGAERLVVDAAVGLQRLGHEVTVYTSYRNTEHCFDEARDGTLDVRVRGDNVVPTHIGGRAHILCAILRQFHLVSSMIIEGQSYDAIFIDQLSSGIPMLKFFLPATGIMFYCHFPDKYLATRSSVLKRLYRVPFDAVESWTTGQADRILVNSNFTASVFKEAFPSIHKRPRVIYPCVDTAQTYSAQSVRSSRSIALSINRFERKKNLELALIAFSKLASNEEFGQAVLIVAGGYDSRVFENVAYHEELQNLCLKLNLTHQTRESPFTLPFDIQPTSNVYFLLSIPAELKSSLLASSKVLLYTPEREHFGIVPLEASLAGLPVIAQNNGGPLETISDGISGFLRNGEADLWTEVLGDILFRMPESERLKMGQNGRQQVLTRFSQEKMSRNLDKELRTMTSVKPWTHYILFTIVLLFFFGSLRLWLK